MDYRRPPVTPGPSGIDACDARCPSVALVVVEREGLSLMFCGHCFDERVMTLFANGWAVRADYRPTLRQAEDQR